MKITGFGLGPAEFNASMGRLAGDVQKAVGIHKVWCSGEQCKLQSDLRNARVQLAVETGMADRIMWSRAYQPFFN